MVLGGLLWGSDDLGGGWDGEFAEGFILGFFDFRSVFLGDFNLVVVLEASKEVGASSILVLSVSKNHRSRDRKSPFLIPSAQLALGCKAHQDIICIDGSHDFGWF